MFLDHRTVRSALYRHLDPKSRLVTDKAQSYKFFVEPGKHESVDHSKGEYVRGDVHTNTLEGFFSIFKRGPWRSPSYDEMHLDRSPIHFRRTSARARLDDVDARYRVEGVKGKRLTYQTTDRAEAQA